MTVKWELVIGLEVHVQLSTRTKIFCDCRTSFGDPPNRNTCPVCLGLPGALPVLNGAAVDLAVRAALAVGCTVHRESIFARKNYFYPDLPKGYQISQFDRPLATGGFLNVAADGDDEHRIGIHRIHLEEDAGKLVHDRFPGRTAVDLNRAGVPLIEIVSEPALRSAAEAGVYLRRLKQVLEYLAVSDANMEEGSLRVDANVSARPAGATALGVKTEIKNMNSFSGVERAITAEFARQCAVLEQGGVVVQQTMLWDDAQRTVRPARSKEGSHDYRYFPDPDLPTLLLTEERVQAARDSLPELPAVRRARFVKAMGITAADATVLTAQRELADWFEAVAEAHGDARAAANWVRGDVLALCNAAAVPIRDCPVAPVTLARLLDLVRDGALSHSAAKQVFVVLATGETDPRAVAEREGLLQVRDDTRIARWVDAVWNAHPDEVRRLRAGEKKLMGVLVGMVMKESRGSADPRRVSAMLSARVAGDV